MNPTKSLRRWLWIGCLASILSALMTVFALISYYHRGADDIFLKHIINQHELLFTMLYAMSLMIVPFALWYRIEDRKRKWTARVCNGLTTSTAIWASLAYGAVMIRTAKNIYVLGISNSVLGGLFITSAMVTMFSMSTCMGFMGWSLWRGKSNWFGIAAIFLAISPYLHISPTFPEWIRVFWLLWLAIWFLKPLYMGKKKSFQFS